MFRISLCSELKMENASNNASSADVVTDSDERNMDDSTKSGRTADQFALEASPDDRGVVFPVESIADGKVEKKFENCFQNQRMN